MAIGDLTVEARGARDGHDLSRATTQEEGARPVRAIERGAANSAPAVKLFGAYELAGMTSIDEKVLGLEFQSP